ncbi:MAG: hypothetical protein M9922_11910 [Microthrixaceae bacterium]|nr:hypothetical protein [Microthrixaceae bacterium]
MTAIVESIVAALLFEGGARFAAAIAEWRRRPGELQRAADAVNRRTGSTLDGPTVDRFLGRNDFVELLKSGADAAAGALSADARAAGLTVPDPAASVLALLSALSLSDLKLAEQAGRGAVLHALDELSVGLSYVLGELLEPILEVRNALEPGAQERDRHLLLHIAEAEERAVHLFEAVGVEPVLARELATDLGVGTHLETVPGLAVVHTARAGSGKSLCAIRTFEAGLVDAVLDPAAPIPVLLHAGAAHPRGLRASALEACQGLGDPTALGAQLVIDGLDEVQRSTAEGFIAEARALVGAWPRTSATCFGRPDLDYRGAEVQSLPTPTRDELEALAERISGRSQPFYNLPASVWEAVAQPLFAIGVAAIQARSGDIPTSRAGIIRSLVQNRIGDLEVLEDRLIYEDLAVRLAAQGAVSEIEVGSAAADELCASRLAIRDHGFVRFAVPLYGDWFGARALLRDPDVMGTGALDPNTFDRWRYAVSLALSMGSTADADRLAAAVAVVAPAGLALMVADATTPAHGMGASAAPGAAIGAAASRIQQAAVVVHSCLDDALATLGIELIDTSAIEAKIESTSLHVRYPDIDGSRTLETRTFQLGTDPSWPYSEAVKRVREQLAKALQEMLVAPEHEVADAENAWALARFVTDDRSVTNRPVDPTRVLDVIGDLLPEPDAPIRFGWGHRTFAITPAAYNRSMDLVRRAAADGRDLTCPWPTPDREMGPRYDHLYSGLLAGQLLRGVFSAAVGIYEAVVAAYFPTAAPFLAAQATLPAVIRLVYEPSAGRRFSASVFEEWVPLRPGDETRVAVAVSSDFDGMARVRAHQVDPWHGTERVPPPFSRAYWASDGIEHFLRSDRPATEQALRWLATDLDALGWVEGGSIRF